MTSSDRSLERSGVDPEVTAMIHGQAADHADLADDQGTAQSQAGERVYAPASERVPVAPVAGHRHMIDHPDDTTPERVAAASDVAAAGVAEPAFARVPRPVAGGAEPTGWPVAGGPEPTGWPALRPRLFFGLGVSWATVVGCSVGVWWFLRWRRERQKPINRLRRRARRTAEVVRHRVPASRKEAIQPAIGLGAALLSGLIVVVQQARARGRRAERSVPDVDLQQRLAQLKNRWGPRRLELEKITISRH